MSVVNYIQEVEPAEPKLLPVNYSTRLRPCVANKQINGTGIGIGSLVRYFRPSIDGVIGPIKTGLRFGPGRKVLGIF